MSISTSSPWTGAKVITLAPGNSESVSYLAMPILYPDADTFEYGIGEDEVRVLDESGEDESFLRPGDRMEDGLMLPEAIAQARCECDYLIVTRPNRFFFFDSDLVKEVSLAYTPSHLTKLGGRRV